MYRVSPKKGDIVSILIFHSLKSKNCIKQFPVPIKILAFRSGIVKKSYEPVLYLILHSCQARSQHWHC